MRSRYLDRAGARWLAIILCLLVAACGGRACGAGRTQQTTAQNTPAVASNTDLREAERLLGEIVKPSADGSRRDLVNRLDAAVLALEQAQAQSRRDTFDPEAVINSVGRDAGALFAWVRDQTSLVPYQGTLRGVRGVLLDRFGNSLDRSLLLAHLLRLAGHEVRLARASLTPAQAASALTRSAPRSQTAVPTPDAAAEQRAAAQLDSLAASLGIDGTGLRERLRATREAADRAAANAVRQAEAQRATLVAALSDAMAGAAVDANRRATAVADHWWVQQRRGEGWSDLDPLFLASGPGQSSLPAAATFDPERVPPDLQHVIRIRVLVECAVNGQLKEHSVLEHALPLRDTVGVPISLVQVPVQGPPLRRHDLSGEAVNTYRAWLTEQEEWLPVLVLGRSDVSQSSFTTACEIRKPGAAPSRAPMGGFMDALGGGSEPENAPAAGVLSGEFIEYELAAPGAPPRVERRAIVDVIGPAARAEGRLSDAPAGFSTLDLAREVEILPLVAQPSAEYVEHLMAESLVPALKGLAQALRTNTDGANPASTNAPPAPSILHELALARQRWNLAGQSVVLTGPNVLTRHIGLREDAKGLLEWSALDIVVNDVDAFANDQQGVATRLAQGVVDTNAEALLSPSRTDPVNVAELMSAPANAQVNWVIVRPPAIDSRLRTSMTPDLQARIAQDLSRGYVAVVPVGLPAGAPEVGWWRVDPKSGTVLGIDRAGRGGQAGENSVMQVNALNNKRMAMEILKGFLCMLGASVMSMQGLAEKSEGVAVAASLGGIALCAAQRNAKLAGIYGSSTLSRGIMSYTGDILAVVRWFYWALLVRLLVPIVLSD